MLIFYLPGNFVEIVQVSKKCSARITLRRSRNCCYRNPPQVENVASDILYSYDKTTTIQEIESYRTKRVNG